MSEESLLGGEGDAPAPSSEPTLTPSPDFSFYSDDGLNEGLSSHFDDNNKGVQKFFQKYQGAENPNKAAIDGIANLQYMAGQKGFERPADDAPESIRGEFDRKMRELNGAPKEASDYKWERPEGISEEYWNQDQVSGFADILHKHGSSPDMAKDLFEAYTASFDGAQEQAAQLQGQQIDEQRNILKAEYGVDADATINTAIEVGKALGAPQSEIERIGMTAEGVKFLASLKSKITGDNVSDQGAGGRIRDGIGADSMQRANDARDKAIAAHAKGDMESYHHYSKVVSELHQKHADSQR